MIYNFNDIIRKKVYSGSLLQFFLYFDTLTDEEQETLFRIILLDYYKILHTYDKNDLKIFDVDVNCLLEYCKDEPDRFVHIINGGKMFYDMDYVSKAILVDRMEQFNQESKLFSISEMHILDKLTYRIIDDVEYYKEYYIDYINKNKDKLKAVNIIMDFFTLKIIELKITNNNLYKKFILEFIKVYYKWKIFIKEHEGEYLLNPEDFYYIDIIKNNSVDEILNILDEDYDFFITMIGEFFHYSTSKLEIPEKIVDGYFESSSDEKLKEKFKKRE